MQLECGQSGGWWPTTRMSTANADDVSASTRFYLVGTKQRWGAKSGPRPSYINCPLFSPWADQSRRRCWCGTSHRSAPSSDGSAHTYQVSRTRR
jgi:hypothetical protein